MDVALEIFLDGVRQTLGMLDTAQSLDDGDVTKMDLE